MNTVVDLAAAYHFAAVRHVDQRRKGLRAEPYVNHLTEVAELVARATPPAARASVIAAGGHATVEDTGVSLQEIAEQFGPEVAAIVAEVTDDKSLSKAERKRLQVEHAPHASRGAKLIKLADKTANLRALAQSPPPDWSSERRDAYRDWTREVVAGCRGVSPWLEARFDEAADGLD